MSVNDTVKLLSDCSRGAKMGLEAIDAVSYTHLDVYKRQLYPSDNHTI